jgi:hypothetical protein
MNKLPSLEYLGECFELDAKAGTLRWKTRPRSHFRTDRGWRSFNSQRSGKLAGVQSGEEYLLICIGKRLFKVHRIVYALAYGALPEREIDHRDGNRANNRPSNLREATSTQNKLNSRGWGRLGIKGVYRKGPGYEAKLREPGGKTVYLGTFGSAEEAKTAHVEATTLFHGEFGNAGR